MRLTAQDRRRPLAGRRRRARASASGRARPAAGATRSALKVARFGDNMREVAVTEGDKVEAQIRLGFSVNGYGVGDLVAAIHAVSDAAVDAPRRGVRAELRPGARPAHRAASGAVPARGSAESRSGLRAFLEAGGFGAFTDTFEDLDGLAQLPGLAVQRLMADGYGFGAEGDWKTAALVRR